METRRSRRSASAAVLMALLANLVLGAPAGLAADPNIVITVTPLPPTVTLSTAALPTYAGYRVLVENKGANRLNDVNFSGTTTVTGGGSAPFHSCIPAVIGCTAPTTTSMAVTIGTMNSGGGSTFIVVFTAPAASTAAAVNFAWILDYGEGTTDNPNASHADSKAGTAVTPVAAPSTTEVFSFVPEGGGAVFTGTGVAVTADPWSTKVSIPVFAEARVQERAPTSATELCLVSTYTCIGDISTLTIPGTFASLEIRLSIDVTRIRPPGRKIADAKIFYQPDTGTAFEILNCTTPGTLGPDPCISSRIEYTKKNTTNSNLWGDWEFVILASHNGSYRG